MHTQLLIIQKAPSFRGSEQHTLLSGLQAKWLPCTLARGSPLTCYCNADHPCSRSEFSILRKRWYSWSPKWLKAQGVVAGKVAQGWSAVDCLGSGQPFHIKRYIISTWQIWLQDISRLITVRTTNLHVKLYTSAAPLQNGSPISLHSCPLFPLSPKSFSSTGTHNVLPEMAQRKITTHSRADKCRKSESCEGKDDRHPV